MITERPVTTLFLIASVDGKISPGDNDSLDIDKHFPKIEGVCEGLSQYYELEKKTDSFSLNTGRVMKKIGVNERKTQAKKIDVNFIIIDSKPHLKKEGVEYLSKWVKKLYLVTTNKKHPAILLKKQFPNIEVFLYKDKINLSTLLSTMKKKYFVNKITIQSGGTLNSSWIREKLIDYVSIVFAPCLIGGKNTQSIIGGSSLHTEGDLIHVKALKLVKCDVLKDSYLHVKYKVINETKITI